MAIVGKVDSLVDFAASLQQSFIHQDQPINDLSVYLGSLPLYHKNLSSSDRIKLNKHGVALWNLCGRLRQTGHLLPRTELLSQARAFAYLLIESASKADVGLLKNALKAAKECLDAKLPGLALKIVERAAVLQETLGASSAYIAEYLLLRLALAWQQDRLDLAEHFFTKLQTEAAWPAASDARDCVEMLFDIGRDFLAKKNSGLAVRWLERAAVLFEDHDIAGPAAADLRLNVLHTYARALLGLEDANTGFLRARTVLETLQRLYRGDNDAVLLLQLEIVIRGHARASFAGVGALSRPHPTDSHYKVVIHHIHRLRKLDPTHARELLQFYLVRELVTHGNDQWIESTLTMLVWMSTSPECTSSITSLETAFTEIYQHRTKTLSSEATNGILVFLWRRVEKAFDKEDYGDAAAWCKLAMHELLSGRMEDCNAGKVQRKLLQCLLKQSKLGEAREAALKMSANVKRHPLTLYFTYCIATRLNDEDLAQGILMQAKSDGILLACVSETLRYELGEALDVEQTSASICRVFKTAAECIYASRSFSLREIDWFAKTSFDLARKFYQGWSPQLIIQLVGHVSKLPFRVPLDASLAEEDRLIVERLRKRQADSVFALAILLTTQARIAKSGEARIAKYNDAHECAQLFRQNLDPFVGRDGRCIAPESGPSKESYSRLVAQQITLLQVEFEVGLHAPQNKSTPAAHDAKFGQLSEIITEALEFHATARTYAVFADMIISAVSENRHEPETPITADTAANLLRQLISAARGTEGYDVLETSRWIRYVVQLVVSGSKQGIESGNVELVEEVVMQAMTLAATGNSQGRDRQGSEKDAEVADAELGRADPAEELEWLATTLFNLAVDYYVGEKEELGKKWARKAVELADVLAKPRGGNGDGGLLTRVLRDKMSVLGWSV